MAGKPQTLATTSAFEILGPVMVGPSSSHTAGALRCGQVAASLLTAIQTHLDRRAAGAFKVGAVLFSNRNGPLGQTKTADTLLKLWEGA